MLDFGQQSSYLAYMNLRNTWQELSLLAILTLLLTPLRDSVLIPAIENGVVVSLILVGLVIYTWRKSVRAFRS